MRIILFTLLAAATLTACRDRDDGPPGESPSGAPSPTATASPSPAAPPLESATELPTNVPPLPEPGVYTGGMTFGNEERTWRVYVPSSLPAGELVPLVIGMHGGLGSGEQFARNTRFDDQAEAGAFIAVYPDGIGATWNGGRCCGAAVRRNIDDVGFIEALIDRLASEYPIDPARVYATGHSNGAIMAFRLACELSDRIAAIGGVAGSLETGECSPGRPVSVLLIHGDADENHPLEGGVGPESISGVDFTSVAQTMETVRQGMGCAVDAPPEIDGDLTATEWPGCADGVTVRLVVVAGASHAWPGGAGGVLGPASKAIDATAAIWAFFASHQESVARLDR